MKTLRILLIAAFLFAAFVNAAQAQETNAETGFLPIADHSASTLPQRGQLMMAYDRLLPLLFAAQKDGTILTFNPEFAVGAVRVTYAKGTMPPMLAGKRVYANLADAMKSSPRRTEDQAIAKAYNPYFSLDLYSSCPYIEGLNDGDHVKGTLRDQYGKALAFYDEYADAYGIIDYACFYGRFTDMMPGYKVTFKVYDATDALRGTYSVTVPSVAFKTIDQDNSIVSGTGPAGKLYQASWYHPNLDANHTASWAYVDGILSAAKTWIVDFGKIKFRGGDYLDLAVDLNPRFTLYHYMSVPYAYCYLGENYCALTGFSNQAAMMTITHNDSPSLFTGRFSLEGGHFGASLVDTEGYPIFLARGDSVTGTGIRTFRLPNLTANINFDADTISGKAPANKYFSVLAYAVYDVNTASVRGGGGGLWVHSDASGNYVADFSGIQDLISTDTLTVLISYQDPLFGHRSYMYQYYEP